MVDTLIMGSAFKSLLKPTRIIIGTENKNIKFLNNFKKFNCPLFFLSLKQAELIKLSINLYLFNNVTFANAMDYYCRQNNFSFNDISLPIKLDKRIGINSYINSSLGVSGGHLERDVYSIIKTSLNYQTKNYFKNLKKLNDSRINILKNKYLLLNKKYKFSKIIWCGPSYKKSSFSITNSAFLRFFNFLKKKNIHKIFYVYEKIFNNSLLNFKKINNLKIKSGTLLIHNYSNKTDKNLISEIIRKNRNIFCIDIALNDSVLKKNSQDNYLKIF